MLVINSYKATKEAALAAITKAPQDGLNIKLLRVWIETDQEATALDIVRTCDAFGIIIE